MKPYRKITLLVLAALLVVSLLVCGGMTTMPAEAKGKPPTITPTPTATTEPGYYSPGNTTYYVSPSGSDSNPGTSPSQAWQTIAKVNDVAFAAGDEILFEGGQTFAGTVEFDGLDSGADGNPIDISSYGSGRAVINGGNGNGIKLLGSSWVNVVNINATGSGRLNNDQGAGVWLQDAQHVDVSYFEGSHFQRAGVYGQDSSYVNVTHVYVHDNGMSGIWFNGWRPFGEEVACNYIYVGYSTAYNNQGDPTVTDNHSGNGIMFGGVKHGVIEYSVASYNGCCMPWNGNGPVGIWTYCCDSVNIHHNISHHNQSPGYDGGGFDLDGGTKNSVVQYNYSYENDGAGYLAYSQGAEWETYVFGDNTIRYNISKNDGKTDHGVGIKLYTDDGVDAYHHTVVSTIGKGGIDGCSGCGKYNNIFYANVPDTGLDANGNYWGLYGGYNNPLLVNPTVTDWLNDATQLSTLTDYKIQSWSPCINVGYNLPTIGIDPGPHDFWGTTIPVGGGYDVGAHEYSSSSPTATPNPTNTPPPSGNLVQNPGFESDFANWDDWGNTSVSSDAHSGAKAARVGTGGGGRYQFVTLDPNTDYVLGAWGKVGTGSETGWIGIKNESGFEYQLSFNTTSYSYQEVEFTTPSDASGLKVYVWKNAGAGSYFTADDFTLTGPGSPPPTDTPIPPTHTPVPPTHTPVPPTHTPIPPTDTPVPGGNLVQNPGFESDFDHWSDWGNTAISSDAHSGTKAARVGTGAGGRYQFVTLDPNTDYVLGAWGKVGTGSETGFVGIKNESGFEHQLSFNTTSYSYQEVEFTTPSDASGLKVYVWKNAGAGSYFAADDFTLTGPGSPPPTNTPVPPTDTPIPPTDTPAPSNLVQNPGFESDFDHWSDWGNTAISSDAHSGAKAARVGTGAGGRYQFVTLDPNTGYTLGGWGKVGTGSETGWIGIKNESGWEYSVSFSTTSYAYKEVGFTTPSNTSGIKVYIWKNSGANSYFFADDVSLME